MNYKRAFLFSLLAYVISFFVGLIFALIFSVDFSGDEPVPRVMWYVGLVASVIIMASLTFWYFKSDSTKASMCNGLMFGSIAVVLGFILDALIFIPAALSGRANDLIKYYSTPLFWITLVAVIATTTLVGYLLGRKSGDDKAIEEETSGEPEPSPKTFVPVPEKPVEPKPQPEADEPPAQTPEEPAPPPTPPPPTPQTPKTPETPVEPSPAPEPQPEAPEPPAKTPPSNRQYHRHNRHQHHPHLTHRERPHHMSQTLTKEVLKEKTKM